MNMCVGECMYTCVNVFTFARMLGGVGCFANQEAENRPHPLEEIWAPQTCWFRPSPEVTGPSILFADWEKQIRGGLKVGVQGRAWEPESPQSLLAWWGWLPEFPVIAPHLGAPGPH